MILSHSKVSTYSECPLKWKFKYIDKRREKPKHYFSLGKSVHSALEFMYDPEKHEVCPPVEDVLEALESKWISVGYKDKKDEKKYKKQAEKMITQYHEKYLEYWDQPLAIEKKFTMEFGNVTVTGFIDKVDILPNGKLHITDYKTGRMWDLGKTESDEQCTMYQYAASQLFNAPVGKLTLLHVPTQTNDSCPNHVDVKIDALRDKYAKTLSDIEAKKFDPKPADLACSRCDHKAFCPVWEE